MLIELSGVDKHFAVRKRRGLRFERSVVRAVDQLSFSVGAGEVVGYLGPNGAGKSTTIKMLTGILTPSGGTVRVAGLDPVRQRIPLARQVGVVFGQRTTLWWDLPLRDSFDLIRQLYRVPRGAYARTLARLIELLDLGDLLDIPVRQLSLGQRMRGDLTAALVYRPRILYLDEPTIGLDVVSKAAIREFLAELNTVEGTTILLTTHDLDDIERLCRRVIVIDHGTLAFDGDLDTLRSRAAAERTLVVDLAMPAPPLDIPGVRVSQVDGPRQFLVFPAAESAARVVAAVMAGHEVLDIAVREPDIEDVVAQLYLGRV
jgi:viologen exporter family transport system ATP-binding protein